MSKELSCDELYKHLTGQNATDATATTQNPLDDGAAPSVFDAGTSDTASEAKAEQLIEEILGGDDSADNADDNLDSDAGSDLDTDDVPVPESELQPA
jgi:hypothetical protein